jgi:predicted DNA-binding protein
MLAIRLPEDNEQRLDALAKATGRSNVLRILHEAMDLVRHSQ